MIQGMSDVPAEILHAAHRLFTERGFGQTTIQEIADEVGISKGAVYLHFRSKSDVLTALLRDLEQRVLARVLALRDREDLGPLDRLREQLRLQFAEVQVQRILFENCLQDAQIALDEELGLVAQKGRVDWQTMQEEFVRAAFPALDDRQATELAVCLNGALNEYYTYVLLEGAEIDPDAVASLLVALAPAMAAVLVEEQPTPVLDRSSLSTREELEGRLRALSEERVERALSDFEAHAEEQAGDQRAEILETVDALRHTLAQESPSRIVLQGLLANLREWKSLAGPRKTLAHELGLKLV